MIFTSISAQVVRFVSLGEGGEFLRLEHLSKVLEPPCNARYSRDSEMVRCWFTLLKSDHIARAKTTGSIVGFVVNRTVSSVVAMRRRFLKPFALARAGQAVPP